MRKILLVIFFLVLSNCSSKKVQYWCGDHVCNDKKERLKYFRETLIVEHKIINDSDKNIEKDYIEILNNKKFETEKIKKNKFKMKKKKKAKLVKLPDNKIESLKSDNEIAEKKQKKSSSKKLEKIASHKEFVNKDFEIIIDNIIDKSAKLKYPDINNFPE